MNAIPRPDLDDHAPEAIPGMPPDLLRPPEGCRFHPRCAWQTSVCREVAPPWVTLTSDHHSLCHYAGADFAGSQPISAAHND